MKNAKKATPGQVSFIQEGAESLERNKQLVRRFVDELLNKQNMGAIEQIMARDAVLHHSMLPKPARGLAEIRQVIEGFHTGFPDMKVRIESLIAEGDQVALSLSCQGTQKGIFAQHQPTNQAITWTAINILTIRHDQIVDQRACDDVIQRIEATC